MEGLPINIIKKESINLSRNSPAALIVGVAGFLGSNLADKLLSKNIQVIGIDNFSTGMRDNLTEATKDKKFHLINSDAEDLAMDLPRLDYIFVVAEGGWRITRILEMAKQYSSKVVFVSSIELYDRNFHQSLDWFKKSESELAEFAGANKLNARVIRLGAVFGPRMHFRIDDPLIRLIQSALNDELQKEPASMEFSSRALFIDDAVNIILKSMMAGSTAQKIFDGVADPVKVAEVKQILLDPVWHESRGFGPSALPPWPTPNMEKTRKILSWKPQTNLVRALKETLHYFKETGQEVPKPEFNPVIKAEAPFKMEHQWKEKIEEFKADLKQEISQPKKRRAGLKRQHVVIFILFLLVSYGLIYPVLGVAWNIVGLRLNLDRAVSSLEKGRVRESLSDLLAARSNLAFLDDLSSSFSFTLDMGILNHQLSQIRQNLKFYNRALAAGQDSLTGANTLYESLKIVSGEGLGDLTKETDAAKVELEGAILELTTLGLDLKNSGQELPLLNLNDYLKLTSGNQVIAKLLPSLIPSRGTKSYLVVLEDTKELWPTGGKITTLARIDFADGKLKKIEPEDLKTLDKNLIQAAEPPKDLKKDLNLTSWGLSTSNFEPDFPTSARQMIWFYQKESGKSIDGVLTFDSKAMQNLELGGDLVGALNKIFFLPNLNWPQIVNNFAKSFEEKHINIYLSDSKLFSFLSASGFSGSLPAPNQTTDFLEAVETNIGGNKVNGLLDRRYNLETNIDDLGRITHQLKISYINGGKESYKNRMRIYFPAGTKLTRASWSELDLLKDAVSFTEYGRGGESFVFELSPKEQRTLILEYSIPLKLNLKVAGAKYTLDVLKQPGTDQDPFIWTLKGVKQKTVNTDLLKDRKFEVEFSP